MHSPAALYDAGLGYMRAGRHSDAKFCCQRALAIDPGHLNSLHLMGLLALQAQQYDDAIEWIGLANRADPKTDYLLSLGTALEQQGFLEEALKAIENAARIRPDDAELWTRGADLLVKLQRPDQAIGSLEHALKVDPRYWQAANNCAVLLLKLERFEDALIKLNLCDELQPNHAPTVQARGSTLHYLNRFEEALSESRRAEALDSTNAEIYNNLGVTLQKLRRYEDALEQFDRALDLRPKFVEALNNKASVLSEVRRFDEAVVAYHHLKEIDPGSANADWNAALIHLLSGNFQVGWRGREARWEIPFLPGTAAYPKFAQPMWRGERIEGKTILVCADEGLGDTIQFVRYVPMLSASGARVILLPQESLYLLLSGLPGVTQCLPNLHGGVPPFDLHCPIMSLPMAFGTTLDTIPAPTSYLPRPAEARVQAWEDRLGAHDRPRIGLVWSGNPKHGNDQNRSIPLRMFSRIIDLDATFVSLQKDPRPADKSVLLERTDIVDLTEHLTDFVETAGLICCLDLVITVDTSVAHLAAALGCPTWILLPYIPDWRWLLDRDDSPWYPTVRLFRQSATRDYQDVIDRIRTDLLTLISAK
jgi:tetratricopeptide (TPR) repeat protein